MGVFPLAYAGSTATAWIQHAVRTFTSMFSHSPRSAELFSCGYTAWCTLASLIEPHGSPPGFSFSFFYCYDIIYIIGSWFHFCKARWDLALCLFVLCTLCSLLLLFMLPIGDAAAPIFVSPGQWSSSLVVVFHPSTPGRGRTSCLII